MASKKEKGVKLSARTMKGMELINSKFGAGTVSKMGAVPSAGIKTLSTGRMDLDLNLGGGLPAGGVVEIYGKEAVGKTGLVLDIVAKTQEDGGLVGFIDMEHALNLEYCERVGVDIDSLVFAQPENGEDAIEILRVLIATGDFSILVIDSVAALSTKAMLEGEAGAANMGAIARLLGQSMKMVVPAAKKTETTLIFVNQLRDTMNTHGAKETTTGGNALKFACSVRMDIRKTDRIMVGAEVAGFVQTINIVKNKLGNPFKKVVVDIIYGKGIDKMFGFVDACIDSGVIIKTGGFYEYMPDTKKVRGKKALLELLNDSPELVEILEEKLKNIK